MMNGWRIGFALIAARKVTFRAIVRMKSNEVVVVYVDETTRADMVTMIDVNNMTRADVVVVIDVDKITRVDIFLRRHETIVASRKRIRLILKRLLVTLPTTKRVIHLLLPEQM